MQLSKLYLLFTLFVSGFSVLCLEILGTRMLAPMFGTTVYTWSSMITVTLIFLSIGYFLGGKLADRQPNFAFFYLIVLLSGAAILLSQKIVSPVLMLFSGLDIATGTLLSSLFLFGPAMFLFGILSPYAIKLSAEKLATLGLTSGKIFAVSTLGSFAGAITTGFWLIPNFSVSATLQIVSGLLFTVSAAYLLKSRKHLIFLALLILFLLPPVKADLPKGIKLLYATDSLYGRIKVFEHSGLRCLLLNEATQSCIRLADGKSALAYTAFFTQIKDLKPNTKKVLLLGLGGGTIANALQNQGIEVTSIEIDPKIDFAAKQFFSYSGNTIIDDARHFLSKTPDTYDVIMLDAYAGSSLPQHLFTEEFFALAKSHLNPDGLLLINLLNLSAEDTDIFKSTYKTLGKAFSQVHFTQDQEKSAKIILAFDKGINLTTPFLNTSSAKTMSDDFANADFLITPLAEKFRRTMFENYGSLLAE